MAPPSADAAACPRLPRRPRQEGAAHRREQRLHSGDCLLLRLAAAFSRLQAHHGSRPPPLLQPLSRLCPSKEQEENEGEKTASPGSCAGQRLLRADAPPFVPRALLRQRLSQLQALHKAGEEAAAEVDSGGKEKPEQKEEAGRLAQEGAAGEVQGAAHLHGPRAVAHAGQAGSAGGGAAQEELLGQEDPVPLQAHGRPRLVPGHPAEDQPHPGLAQGRPGPAQRQGVPPLRHGPEAAAGLAPQAGATGLQGPHVPRARGAGARAPALRQAAAVEAEAGGQGGGRPHRQEPEGAGAGLGDAEAQRGAGGAHASAPVRQEEPPGQDNEKAKHDEPAKQNEEAEHKEEAPTKVFPAGKGTLRCKAFRVPSIDPSFIDLTCEVQTEPTYEDICAEVTSREPTGHAPASHFIVLGASQNEYSGQAPLAAPCATNGLAPLPHLSWRSRTANDKLGTKRGLTTTVSLYFEEKLKALAKRTRQLQAASKEALAVAESDEATEKTLKHAETVAEPT